MLESIKKLNASSIFYFDATGGITKNVKKQKAPFLYSMVVYDGINHNIIPIAEFLTTSHTQTNISKYLISIRSIFDKHLKFKETTSILNHNY
jgi:hypothetical protein